MLSAPIASAAFHAARSSSTVPTWGWSWTPTLNATCALLRWTGPARHTTDERRPTRRQLERHGRSGARAARPARAESGAAVFITNHVFAGAIAGSVYRRRPVRAFAVGFATH